MAFCRHCEVSWAVGDRCWLCRRRGEAGTFPRRWLVAGDDLRPAALDYWRDWAKAWRADARTEAS